MEKGTIFSKNILEQCLESDVIQAMSDVTTAHKKAHVIRGGKVIAEVFGAQKVFESLAEGTNQEEEKTLIGSFHNNLTLLIQKTWVEKSDEVLKDQVLYKLDEVCALMNNQEYAQVYEGFIELLNESVFLMFGAISTKDDFSEYALRIDPGFGVFWWFLKSISATMPKDVKVGRLYLLLGMMFLANY